MMIQGRGSTGLHAAMSTEDDHGQRTARDLVKEIAKERGYLGEEQLAKIGDINPDLRREVEEALLRKDEMIGSAVLTYVLEADLSLLTGMLTLILGLQETFTLATPGLSSNCFRMRMTIITARPSPKVRTRMSPSRYTRTRSLLSAMRMASRPRT